LTIAHPTYTINHMVNNETLSLDLVFRALASGPRRDILRHTAAQPCTVTQLSAYFDMSLAAVSKHVGVLAKAGLISLTREGRLQWCRLKPEALAPVRTSVDALYAFWDARLDALEAVLAEDAPAQPPSRSET
jgi:DNA-binding transcriptional ArsR family regulator